MHIQMRIPVHLNMHAYVYVYIYIYMLACVCHGIFSNIDNVHGIIQCTTYNTIECCMT